MSEPKRNMRVKLMSVTEAMRKRKEIMKLEANLMGIMCDLEDAKKKIGDIENEIRVTKENILERIKSLKDEHNIEHSSFLV